MRLVRGTHFHEPPYPCHQAGIMQRFCVQEIPKGWLANHLTFVGRCGATDGTRLADFRFLPIGVEASKKAMKPAVPLIRDTPATIAEKATPSNSTHSRFTSGPLDVAGDNRRVGYLFQMAIGDVDIVVPFGEDFSLFGETKART